MPTATAPPTPALAAPKIFVNPAFFWRISIIGSLAGILYGYDIGIIDAAMTFAKVDHSMLNPTFTDTSVTPNALTDFAQEIITSAVLVGVMVGSLIGGQIADRIGRRATLLWGCLIFIAGSLLAQFAPEIYSLISARFVLGLSIGFTSVTAPVYLSELAPPQSRGKIIGLYQLALTLGIALSNLVGWLFADSKAWHAMFGVGAVPAAILFLLTLTLPESPRWLCAKGLTDKATKILNSYTNPQGAAFLLDEIQTALQSSVKTSWAALFTKKVRPFTFIASGFLMLVAATGINAVIYYGTAIFGFAGVSEAKAEIQCNLLITTLNVVATFIGLSLIDKIGRKPLTYIGTIGMALSLFLLALAFHNPALFGATLGVVAVGCLSLYITSFGLSLGIIAWVIAAEVFPLPVRGRGIAAASTAFGLVNLLVALFSITLINKMGATATFAMYGAFCLLTLLFVIKFFPETKGLELEEISKSPQTI